MANVIKKATNRFTKGLIMDFSPENTKDEVLTNALNATLLTFNGNELSLQNDMGNARVETAYLPAGYIPVGTCEYGGIIYIVSYNPLEDKSLIGCFPSPERNISNDELGHLISPISYELFLDIITGEIKQASYSVLLKLDNLNPGDKFIITSNNTIYLEKIKDLYKKDTEDNFILQENPIIALNIVSIEDNGKIVYLNSDVRQYEVIREITEGDSKENKTFRYSILGSEKEGTSITKLDIDSYRNAVSSGYSVFRSKVSGKLAILAELIMIDSYNVSHSIVAKPDSSTEFDIIIHTEISPELDNNNYFLAPKLKYYYLSNSQGYLQTVQNSTPTLVPLFKDDNSTSNFYNVKLNDIYTTNNEKLFNKTLKQTGMFNFPLAKTYHGRLNNYTGEDYINDDVYTKFFKKKYHKVNLNLIKGNTNYFYTTLQATIYKYNTEGSGVEKLYEEETLNPEYTYYVKVNSNIYININRNALYKNETLYEIEAVSELATEEIIKDETVEKFKYQLVEYYKKASLEDISLNKTLYYKEEEDGSTKYFQEVNGYDKNKEYYVKETITSLVSIGNIITNLDSLKIYYYPGTKVYYAVSEEKKDIYFNIPNNQELPFDLYRLELETSYREATELEISEYNKETSKLYYINNYIKVPQSNIDDDTIKEDDILFIVTPNDVIITKDNFIPNKNFNYIKNVTEKGDYPKDDPIEVLVIADFLPVLLELTGKYLYNDVILASIKIPDVVINNGLDLPFKYDYTIVPCMNYGKLNHLAVSNTVDFSKLHAFNQSDFHTWKYFVENGLLRLTFGADIFDTYEQLKVDGIILEFYDLWGYAGTLEITDKKSYSGTFTKILSLSTPNALSNKKIINDVYNNLLYVRNIEILDHDGIYKYKNFEIEHNNITGWTSKDPTKTIDNDCGVIYPNIIYGVKAYFRRTVNEVLYEFIHKKDFFLYTLPIFNEYYNSVLDFNTIGDPELLFTLTYKLEDSSVKTVLTLGDITNGYNEEDYDKIASYLNGNYPSNSLEIVKYYNYKGTSKLYLEIGLNEDYKNFNLFNHLDLNKHYSCKLLIVSTSNETQPFDVKLEDSEITDINYILNYKSDLYNTNSLYFEGGDSNQDLNDISTYNFMGKPNPIPLNINYNFNVGYKASVTNITTTQIPATTICALYHKKPDGVYNHEDFGLYEVLLPIDGVESTYLLYDRMVFTTGHWDKAILGICRQKDITGDLDNLCDDTVSYETGTTYFTKPFALHSGETLKLIVPRLGKLMFGLPHIHGSPSHVYECNLTKNEDGSGVLAIPAAVKGQWEISRHDNDSFANYPMHWYFNSPLYNLLVNTLDSIKYNNEFISALDFIGYIKQQYMDRDGHDRKNGWTDRVWQIKFAGFTGLELVTFSQKLLTSMSSIYAYNPDYDLLNVNTGKVEILKECPVFNSNIINTYSAFNKDIILNDYIYFGGMLVSKYLENLTTYSGILTTKSNITKKPLDLLNFIANFENCGTEVNPILLQSLTYKASIPIELSDDLIFDSSQRLVLKHSNGSTLLINGIPNKKTLYGYDPVFNKLVQLDVSNYIINDDGTLELNYLEENDPIYDSCTITLKENLYNYEFTSSLHNIKGTFNMNFDWEPEPLLNFRYVSYDDAIYLIMFNRNNKYNGNIYINYDTNIISSNFNKSYMHRVDWATSIVTIMNNPIENIQNLTKDNLEDLLKLKNNITVNGTEYTLNYYLRSVQFTYYENKTTITCPNDGDFLYIIKLKEPIILTTNINYKFPTEGTFINTIKTYDYSKITEEGHKYSVIPKYDNARFRGTSITINDLIYEPNIDSHRLYMKNNIYSYTFSNKYYNDHLVENKICYRITDWDIPNSITGYQNYNDLFMATGPCFTSDNL